MQQARGEFCTKGTFHGSEELQLYFFFLKTSLPAPTWLKAMPWGLRAKSVDLKFLLYLEGLDSNPWEFLKCVASWDAWEGQFSRHAPWHFRVLVPEWWLQHTLSFPQHWGAAQSKVGWISSSWALFHSPMLCCVLRVEHGPEAPVFSTIHPCPRSSFSFTSMS